MIGGGRKGNVGNIACAVAGHARSALPRGFCEERAGSAAAGRRLAVCRGIVPGGLGNVAERRGVIGIARSIPIGAWPFTELGTTHARDFRNARRKVYGRDTAV